MSLFHLALLGRYVENSGEGSEISVTLFVKGALISGTMIPRIDYLKFQRETLGGELAEHLFSPEIFKDAEKAEKTEEEKAAAILIDTVYLKDPSYQTGDKVSDVRLKGKTVTLAVDYNSIDGWVCGIGISEAK